MTRKKSLCLLFILILGSLVSSVSARDDTPLLCGIATGYPPYQYVDDKGRPTGIDADVARLVFRELGRPILFVQKKWDDVYLSLAHRVNTVDLLCGAEVNERRKELFDFSMPYYNRAVGFFVKSGSPYNNVADLRGKFVAGDRDGRIERIIDMKQLRVLKTASKEDSFIKLRDGRVEAVIAPLTVGNWLCKSLAIPVRILPEQDEGSPVAFAVAKGNTELAGQITRVLEKLMREGRIKEVMDAYR